MFPCSCSAIVIVPFLWHYAYMCAICVCTKNCKLLILYILFRNMTYTFQFNQTKSVYIGLCLWLKLFISATLIKETNSRNFENDGLNEIWTRVVAQYVSGAVSRQQQ